MIKAQCEICKKEYETHHAWYKKRKHHFCSKECMGEWRHRTIKGENHPQFRKNTTNYFSVHDWMVKIYGKADRCVHCKKENPKKYYEWALKKGKEHKRDRSHYISLCKPCHFKYDFTKKWHQNIINGQKRRREREATT